MDRLEQKLSSLPKAKLPAIRNYRIRFALFFISIKKPSTILDTTFNFNSYAKGAIIAVLLLAISVSLPVYAYASGEITADSPLYFLKRSVEKIEMALAPSNAKPALHIKMAERRLIEADSIAKRGNDERSLSLRIAAVQEAQNEEQKAGNAAGLSATGDDLEKIKEKKLDLYTKENDVIKKIANDVSLEMKGDIIENVAKMIDEQSGKDHLLSSAGKKMKNDALIPPGDIGKKADLPATGTTPNIAPSRENAKASGARERELQGIKNNNGFQKKDQECDFINKTKASSSPEALDIKKRLNILKANFGTFKATGTLKNSGGNNAQKLFEKMKAKIENAEQKLESGNISEANGMVKSTEALEGFTKFLLRDNRKPTSTVQGPERKEKDEQDDRRKNH
jgi:hypothetical protein